MSICSLILISLYKTLEYGYNEQHYLHGYAGVAGKPVNEISEVTHSVLRIRGER